VLGVYEIIVRQHDPWLVLLSVPIALFGAYTTVRLLVHGAMRPAGRARLWLAAASLAAGSSMWATHFVDLLSFRVAGPVCYDIGPTILTLLAAVVISGAGLSLALHGPQRWLHVAGGAVLGLGIAVTHYLGMSAAPLHGFLTWDLLMVRASVLAGCALSAAAVLVALGYSSIRPSASCMPRGSRPPSSIPAMGRFCNPTRSRRQCWRPMSRSSVAWSWG
jgi:NO-binding membrane sensor protein with MHYT domain